MSVKRIQKELMMFSRDPCHGISVECPDEADQRTWSGSIDGPPGTPYEGGRWTMSITFPERYPMKPPVIRFMTQVAHPNVGEDGQICLDILDNRWSPALTVAKTLLSISSLLMDPNPSSPMRGDLADMYHADRDEYTRYIEEETKKYAMNHA